MNKEKTVSQAINERYSERNFDSNRKIEKTMINTIVEAGLKAPNGFGYDAWKFIIITNDMDKIEEATLSQPAVQNAAFVVVGCYAKKGILNSDPKYFERKLMLNNYSKEKNEFYLANLAKLLDTDYFKAQVPYATTNMVLQAKALGIDSVIMGGFNEELLAEKLNIDLAEYGIVTVTAFGYASDMNAKRQTINRDKNETIEYFEFEK